MEATERLIALFPKFKWIEDRNIEDLPQYTSVESFLQALHNGEVYVDCAGFITALAYLNDPDITNDILKFIPGASMQSGMESFVRYIGMSKLDTANRLHFQAKGQWVIRLPLMADKWWGMTSQGVIHKTLEEWLHDTPSRLFEAVLKKPLSDPMLYLINVGLVTCIGNQWTVYQPDPVANLQSVGPTITVEIPQEIKNLEESLHLGIRP